MDLPWGDPRSNTFVTNVGLITSTGPKGPNVMAAEWTHHISYKPGLIAICVNPRSTTHANIEASKEFGVHIAASDQNILASIAGNNHGSAVDKVKVLTDLGFSFVAAKKIRAPMIAGAVMHAECKLFETQTVGDHTMFVGEVIEASVDSTKTPLILHDGKYWHWGEQMKKPSQEEREHMQEVVERYRRT